MGHLSDLLKEETKLCIVEYFWEFANKIRQNHPDFYRPGFFEKERKKRKELEKVLNSDPNMPKKLIAAVFSDTLALYCALTKQTQESFLRRHIITKLLREKQEK